MTDNILNSSLDSTAAQPYRRFTILPDGLIACQMVESNPLPGPSVARLKAGVHWTLPGFDILPDSLVMMTIQPADMEVALHAWLHNYIRETLPFLQQDEDTPEELKALLNGIAEQGGIAERATLTLPELTPEHRATLRKKGLRLGPVHIYYSAILKPAPLTLRALLWATHRSLSHPLPYPRAGVTSYGWPDDVHPDPQLQHWFGYPLYARRGCRVDRVDKVICDVYDSAAKGVFTVKNAWAEWLGCKIEDVCGLLNDLGHTRVTPVVAETVEGAEKTPIEYRLKSDRPARPPQEKRKRTPRPKQIDKRKPKTEGDKNSVKPFKQSGKRDDKKRSDKKPDAPRDTRPAKDAPLMTNPFANLKDMLGQK